MSEAIALKAMTPFAQGGNRLCFVDPSDSNCCIKLLRADRTSQIKRKEKSGLSKLRPLSYFDDNLQELKVFKHIDKSIGELAYQLIPRCYGFVATDLGLGLKSELIRDDDGLISMSLKQYLWQNDYNDEATRAVKIFLSQWQNLAIPSRNLLLHNIVVQQKEGHIARLVVIDGLGWPNFLALSHYFPTITKSKAKRKSLRLHIAIEQLLEIKRTNGNWGYHGWMDNEKRIMALKND